MLRFAPTIALVAEQLLLQGWHFILAFDITAFGARGRFGSVVPVRAFGDRVTPGSLGREPEPEPQQLPPRPEPESEPHPRDNLQLREALMEARFLTFRIAHFGTPAVQNIALGIRRHIERAANLLPR